jgi:hypothetical protein|tara:strand:+ start:184 stop:537 length:354 start_codon:yes stop_codon:yes gene_type:complete
MAKEKPVGHRIVSRVSFDSGVVTSYSAASSYDSLTRNVSQWVRAIKPPCFVMVEKESYSDGSFMLIGRMYPGSGSFFYKHAGNSPQEQRDCSDKVMNNIITAIKDEKRREDEEKEQG